MQNAQLATRPLSQLPRGFSIIEVIVAIVLLAVGILGLASTSAVVIRQLAAGEKQTLAANVSLARLELLWSTDCRSLTGGSATIRGITDIWTITPMANALTVTDTVIWSIGDVRKAQAYKTVIPCG